jgi:hypothetical protein
LLVSIDTGNFDIYEYIFFIFRSMASFHGQSGFQAVSNVSAGQ